MIPRFAVLLLASVALAVPPVAAYAQGASRAAPSRMRVEGVVLDEQGSPIQGASVFFYQPEAVASRGSDGLHPQSRFRRPHPEKEGFDLVFRQAAITDQTGSFSTLLLLPGGEAGAKAGWYADAIHPDLVTTGMLPVNGERLEFRLERPGVVGGQLVVDDLIESFRVFVEVEDRRASVGANGAFEVGHVAPGVRDVAFYFGFDEEPFLVVEGVSVAAGEVSVDPRLARIDARGAARIVSLECVTPEGREIRGFQVCPLDRPGVVPWFSTSAKLVIPTKDDALDIAVAGFPSRIRRLRGVIGAQRVVLPDPIEVELSVAGGALLPDPPFLLSPILEPADASDLPEMRRILQPYLGEPVVDERRRARVLVPDFGEYRAAWMLKSHPLERGSRNLVISEWTPIVVRDVATHQVFPVALGPESVARAIEARRGR